MNFEQWYFWKKEQMRLKGLESEEIKGRQNRERDRTCADCVSAKAAAEDAGQVYVPAPACVAYNCVGGV